MTFDEPDCVLGIVGNGVNLYFWNTLDNGDTIFTNKLLVYGTTFLYKIIYDFKENIHNDKPFPYKVYFTYCGLNFEFYKNKMFYIDLKHKKHEVYIPFFKFSGLRFPKFIHSWNKKDCEKYKAENVILSFENKIYDIGVYKEGRTNTRLLRGLPNYIYDNLK